MMRSFNIGEIIEVKVKPNTSRSEIIFSDDEIIVCLKSLPVENKANLELEKIFRKQLKIKVEIVSGKTSKKKRLRVIR